MKRVLSLLIVIAVAVPMVYAAAVAEQSTTKIDFSADVLRYYILHDDFNINPLTVISSPEDFGKIFPSVICPQVLFHTEYCLGGIMGRRYCNDGGSFFNDKYLVTFAFESPSGGDIYEVHRVDSDGNIYIKQTQKGMTGDVGNQFIVIELDKSFPADTKFNLIFDSIVYYNGERYAPRCEYCDPSMTSCECLFFECCGLVYFDGVYLYEKCDCDNIPICNGLHWTPCKLTSTFLVSNHVCNKWHLVGCFGDNHNYATPNCCGCIWVSGGMIHAMPCDCLLGLCNCDCGLCPSQQETTQLVTTTPPPETTNSNCVCANICATNDAELCTCKLCRESGALCEGCKKCYRVYTKPETTVNPSICNGAHWTPCKYIPFFSHTCEKWHYVECFGDNHDYKTPNCCDCIWVSGGMDHATPCDCLLGLCDCDCGLCPSQQETTQLVTTTPPPVTTNSNCVCADICAETDDEQCSCALCSESGVLCEGCKKCYRVYTKPETTVNPSICNGLHWTPCKLTSTLFELSHVCNKWHLVGCFGDNHNYKTPNCCDCIWGNSIHFMPCDCMLGLCNCDCGLCPSQQETTQLVTTTPPPETTNSNCVCANICATNDAELCTCKLCRESGALCEGCKKCYRVYTKPETTVNPSICNGAHWTPCKYIPFFSHICEKWHYVECFGDNHDYKTPNCCDCIWVSGGMDHATPCDCMLGLCNCDCGLCPSQQETTQLVTTTPATTTTSPETTTTAATTPPPPKPPLLPCNSCKLCGIMDSITDEVLIRGRILGENEPTIFDAIEILKNLVGIPGIIDECGNARNAALITEASKKTGELTVFDVLEILQHLVGMKSRIVI